jgi:hypothetical protein
LREEHKLKVIENRVLRNYLGLRENEVTGDWRRLQNEDLFERNSSPHMIGLIKLRI